MASYKIRTAGNCPAVLFTIWSPFNIRIGRGNSLPIRLLQPGHSSLPLRKLESDAGHRSRDDRCRRNNSSLPLRKLESDADHLSRNDRCRRNHSSLPLRKLESDAGHRSRDGRCRRAIPHCCDDGAAVIRKSGPEIKNRCSNEAVSGQSMQRFPN